MYVYNITTTSQLHYTMYKGQGYMEDFDLVCNRDVLGRFFYPLFLSHIYSMYLCGLLSMV